MGEVAPSESGARSDLSRSRQHILFFGFLAARDRLGESFAAETAPQVSAVKFQTALLEGLRANDAEIAIVAALPIRSFPGNPTLIVPREDFILPPDIRGVLAFSINLPLVKLALRLLTSVSHGRRMLAAGKGRSGIIVYSAHTPYVAAALWLRRRFDVPFLVFIPDLPMHMRGKKLSGLGGWIKRLDSRLLRRLIAKADIVFPITQALADDWLPVGQRIVVVEGIAPAGEIATPRSPSGRHHILYTGAFSYMLKAVQMFVKHPEIDARWTMVGDGPDAAALRRLAESDNRLTIKPFMAEEVLDREFEAADFLINPRDTSWEGARYSFPSKLLDYMTRGLPILSTRLPGIPPEYFECFMPLDDSDDNSFAASLTRALAAGQSEVAARIAAGERMLKTEKSAEAVGARVLKALAAC